MESGQFVRIFMLLLRSATHWHESGMELGLRRIAHNSHRAIALIDAQPIEVGSIWLEASTSSDAAWRWRIDNLIPMREDQTSGRGNNRHDCLLKCRSAWDRFAADQSNLTRFMNAKRLQGR